MKMFILIIIIIVSSYLNIYSQNQFIWENSSKGLEGTYALNLIDFENRIYETIKYLYSDDTAHSWHSNKIVITLETGDKYLIENKFYELLKYKDRYLSFGNTNYYSYDKVNWKPQEKYTGIPENSNKIKFYSTDSTFLVQVYNKNDQQNKYKTYITYDSINYNFKPVETDLLAADSIIEYQMYKNTLYATTNSQLGIGYYYHSTDYGLNWIKDSIPEINDRIRYIRFLNDKQYIISRFGIYFKDNFGIWNKCISEELLPDMNREFLIYYNNKIITHSKINDKSTLVSSSDGGLSWEKFGNCDFYIRQLLVKGNIFIANTRFGIKISTDNGETWQDSNSGIFASGSINDNSRLKIIANNNELLTAPRNKMTNNTIMKSYDNGNRWIPKKVDLSYIEREESRVTNDWFSVLQNKWGTFALNGNGHLFKTEDFGETWHLFSETSGGAFLNPQNLYERNDTIFWFYSSQIYYSIDLGKSFNLLDIKYRDNLPDSSFHWSMIDGVYYALNNQFKLYKSENEGLDWQYVTKFDFQGIAGASRIIYIDDNKIYYAPKIDIPGNTPVFVTEDFGLTWKEFNFPFLKSLPTTWLKVNGKLFVLYKEQYKTSIYVTRDNGETWELASKGLEDIEIVDFFAGGNYIFASTKEGLFKAFVETDDVSVEKETIFPIELYPNPASDIIYLKNNHYNLKNVLIYDINGNEFKGINFTNSYFETKNLNSGVFIVKFIFDGDWSIIKKFIKK